MHHRPYTVSTQSQLAPYQHPGYSEEGRGSMTQPPPFNASHFTCNRCANLLSGTCFQTACDCIFCEDCTWKHFEKYSECPKCGTRLGEEDFAEIVVGAGAGDGAFKRTVVQSFLTQWETTRGKSRGVKIVLYRLIPGCHCSNTLSGASPPLPTNECPSFLFRASPPPPQTVARSPPRKLPRSSLPVAP